MNQTIPPTPLEMLTIIGEHITVSENARIHGFKNAKRIVAPPPATPAGLPEGEYLEFDLAIMVPFSAKESAQ